MDLQKEREAFEAWLFREYPNAKDFMIVYRPEENIYEHRPTQVRWEAWQAAKAQAMPEVTTIGNELQSWVAVHSFAAKDGNDIVCAVDANALADEIEKLTGANA